MCIDNGGDTEGDSKDDRGDYNEGDDNCEGDIDSIEVDRT